MKIWFWFKILGFFEKKLPLNFFLFKKLRIQPINKTLDFFYINPEKCPLQINFPFKLFPMKKKNKTKEKPQEKPQENNSQLKRNQAVFHFFTFKIQTKIRSSKMTIRNSLAPIVICLTTNKRNSLSTIPMLWSNWTSLSIEKKVASSRSSRTTFFQISLQKYKITQIKKTPAL